MQCSFLPVVGSKDAKVLLPTSTTARMQATKFQYVRDEYKTVKQVEKIQDMDIAIVWVIFECEINCTFNKKKLIFRCTSSYTIKDNDVPKTANGETRETIEEKLEPPRNTTKSKGKLIADGGDGGALSKDRPRQPDSTNTNTKNQIERSFCKFCGI